MHHRVLPLECGLDRLQVRYVRLEAFHALDRAAVQGAQQVSALVLQVPSEQAADETAHAGDQDTFHPPLASRAAQSLTIDRGHSTICRALA